MEDNKKELIEEFESIKDLAELKALSKYSLETQLTEQQFNRIIELKKKVFKT